MKKIFCFVIIFIALVNGANAQYAKESKVVLQIGSQTVSTVAQAADIVAKLEAGRAVALLIKRGEEAVWVPVRLSSTK